MSLMIQYLAQISSQPSQSRYLVTSMLTTVGHLPWKHVETSRHLELLCNTIMSSVVWYFAHIFGQLSQSTPQKGLQSATMH
jgi:hypothetical protein